MSKTHKYILFGGETFYAKGGWNDIIKSSDDLEELKSQAISCEENSDQIVRSNGDTTFLDWWQIICAQSCQVLHRSKNEAYGN